jgi:hypothetical protein
MIDPLDLVRQPLLIGAAIVVGGAVTVFCARAVRRLSRHLHRRALQMRLDNVAMMTLAAGAATGAVVHEYVVATNPTAGEEPRSFAHRGELPLLASPAMAVATLDLLRRRRSDAMRALLGGQVPDTPAPDVVALRRMLVARARHFESGNESGERRHLLPIGMDGNELVSVPLERGRRVVVGHEDSTTVHEVLRHLANVVATAPWLDDVRLVVTGMTPEDVVDTTRVEFFEDGFVAWSRALALCEGEPHANVVFVSATAEWSMHDPRISVISPAVNADIPGDARTDILRCGDRGWRLESRLRPVRPFAASLDEVEAMRRASEPEPARRLCAVECPGEWAVMMQLLGPLQAVDRNGMPLTFEKSKSLEFLAWLCMHPDRPTPIGARTALWEASVRDSTFNNVVSDLRRSLHEVAHDEVRWPRRLPTDRYELGPHVVTDVDLLLDAIAATEDLAPRDAVRLICDRLANVRGMPFEGMDSDWADTEGITSNIVMTVVAAASLAARLALSTGDDEAVLLATSHGLRMLPGHEELVSLRLVVHERRGERGAWRLYRAHPDDGEAMTTGGVSAGTNRAGAAPRPRS